MTQTPLELVTWVRIHEEYPVPPCVQGHLARLQAEVKGADEPTWSLVVDEFGPQLKVPVRHFTPLTPDELARRRYLEEAVSLYRSDTDPLASRAKREHKNASDALPAIVNAFDDYFGLPHDSWHIPAFWRCETVLDMVYYFKAQDHWDDPKAQAQIRTLWDNLLAGCKRLADVHKVYTLA